MSDKVDPRLLAIAQLIEDSIALGPDEEVDFFMQLSGFFRDRAAMVRFMGDFGSGDGAS